MRVMAEILPGRRAETVQLDEASNGLDLLRALHLAPDAYVLIREGLPIAVDEPLAEGERIHLIRIVSGGT
jgi:sulfur carrier protein ThiS